MGTNIIEIAELKSGEVCVLAVTGRIDSSNAEQLSARAAQVFAQGAKNLVIDLGQVLYLTSAAFRVLLVASDEAERSACRFALCSVAGQVRELFEMGGLLDVFTIHATRAEAMAHAG
jgi:anti-anti-sigma factor